MKISLSLGSDVLYHITGVTAAANIMQSNRFELKPAEGSDWEQKQSEGKFYLSTARSKTSAYLKRSSYQYSVILKLDGRRLGQRFKIKAVDYWETNKAEPSQKLQRRAEHNEMEDRVLSNNQFIDKASNYILEIHAHINDKHKSLFLIKKMGMLRKIPVFFYNDTKELLALDTRKAVEFKIKREALRDTRSEEDKQYDRKRAVHKFRNGFLRRWLELYKMPIGNGDIWDTVKKLNKEHGYRGYQILRYSDAIGSFKADLHNAKSVSYDDPTHERENLDELVKIMRSLKQTPEMFIEALRNKWYPPNRD